MTETPDDSEICFYRDFVANLMRTQTKLDISYQGDNLLRDQLLESLDLPIIKTTLKDRITRTSQNIINIVLLTILAKKRSAGITNANIAFL